MKGNPVVRKGNPVAGRGNPVARKGNPVVRRGNPVVRIFLPPWGQLPEIPCTKWQQKPCGNGYQNTNVFSEMDFLHFVIKRKLSYTILLIRPKKNIVVTFLKSTVKKLNKMSFFSSFL